MSNVAVTKDKYSAKRSVTLEQERKIRRGIQNKPWTKSDATQVLLIERIAGVAALPIVALWTFFAGALSLSLGALLLLFRALGALFRPKHP